MKFKKGDKVKRIRDSHNGMNVGDIDIVVGESEYNGVNLNGYGEGHSQRCLELVGKSNYKPKTPTHVVIWEEDRDPAKLFTSEKEAKEFIRELSEKRDVKKDSIILLEVKSCKKVKVNRVLKYSLHKI